MPVISIENLSHAASSFFFSGFESSAILTVDGVGEWATTTYGTGKGNLVSIFEEVIFPAPAHPSWGGAGLLGGEGTLQLADVLRQGGVRLVRCRDQVTTLAERPLVWEAYTSHDLTLAVHGARIRGWVDGSLVCDVTDDALASGAVGLILDEGTMLCQDIEVRSAILEASDLEHRGAPLQ